MSGAAWTENAGAGITLGGRPAIGTAIVRWQAWVTDRGHDEDLEFVCRVYWDAIEDYVSAELVMVRDPITGAEFTDQFIRDRSVLTTASEVADEQGVIPHWGVPIPAEAVTA